jgi:hypothetical protein
MHLVNHSVLSPEIESVEDMASLAQSLIARGARHLHISFHSCTLLAGLSPFTATSTDVGRFYSRLEAIVDRIAGMVSVRSATVGEAAHLLAPPMGASID